MIRFANPLVFASDLSASTEFYRDLLGAKPIETSETFVLFEGGLGLHDGTALLESIYRDGPHEASAPWGRDNVAFYFESDDLDGDYARIAAAHPLVHALRREPWGGRIFRLHDPDGHVVEIGEPVTDTPASTSSTTL